MKQIQTIKPILREIAISKPLILKSNLTSI